MASLGVAARVGTWATAAICAAAAVALTLIAITQDMETADRIASVIGAIAGLAGLIVSVYFSMRQTTTNNVTVRASGRGATAVRGNVVSNAFGNRSRVASDTNSGGPAPTTSPAAGEIRAQGQGALAADGDVIGNAFGEGSEVEGR